MTTTKKLASVIRAVLAKPTYQHLVQIQIANNDHLVSSFFQAKYFNPDQHTQRGSCEAGTPPPTPRPAFSGGKEAAVFCPTPPVLPGIHTPASPCGAKPGPSLTNNHCSYPHIPSLLIHNQVLEIAENLSTSLSFVQATCFQTLVLNFSFQKTCCHNKP